MFGTQIKDTNISTKKAVCDENIVYILGAGFSAYAGLPVMSNFLTTSKDIYFENPHEYGYFSGLFKKFDDMAKIKNYFSADLFNIEEILSILEMNAAINEDCSDLRNQFINYIKDVVNYYSFPREDFRLYKNNEFGTLYSAPFSSNNEVINRYGYFVASLMNLKLFDDKMSLYLQGELIESRNYYSVITFNYDLIIEDIKNHIENITGRNNSGILPIYKLHGSIDGNIIPPTWAKGIGNGFKEIWQGAFDELTNATQIRIVGYSLPITDSYFRYFLKSSLLKNNRLKAIDIICYDPNGNVEENYSNFIDNHFPGYRFVNKKIDEYFYDIKETIGYSDRDELYFNKLETTHEIFMN